MGRAGVRFVAAWALLVAGPVGAGEAAPPPEDEATRVIAVCDFESAFDGGLVGKFTAGNFRAKITRYELFVTMEDDDREDAETRGGFKASYDADPEQALAFAKKWLDADLLMLGKVEPAGGEALRIAVKVYDQKLGPKKPRLVTTAEVASKYALQAGVFTILGELTGRKDPRYAPLPPDAEERWGKGPNLLPGDFEKGDKHPAGWEPFGVDWQMGEAHWEANPDGPGKCIVVRMSKAVAEMEGVAYYSEFFDIEPGATYRIALRAKTMAPTVKVWVKYYAWLHTPGEPQGQWREVGRTQVHYKGKAGEWGTHQQDCHPRVYLTRAQRVYTPKKCRIGLYAYGCAGVVYFDDVVFKKIADPPSGGPKPYDVGETGRQPVERKE